MQRSKYEEKFMGMWEKRRNNKKRYLLVFVLTWSIFTGGLTMLFLSLINITEFTWINLVIYFVIYAIGGFFLGRHNYKLNEKKYQKVLAREAANSN